MVAEHPKFGKKREFKRIRKKTVASLSSPKQEAILGFKKKEALNSMVKKTSRKNNLNRSDPNLD